MPTLRSVNDEKEPITDGQRACLCLGGFALTAIALLLLIASTVRSIVYGLWIGCIAVACFVKAVCESTHDNGVEVLGQRPSDKCPKCGAEGTIEVYSKKSTEHHPGFFSSTYVTTTVTMVNCMNTLCSYRRRFNLHEQEAARNERREALVDSYRQESIAAATDLEAGGVGGLGNAAPSAEEMASLVANTIEEEERRQELRNMRRDRNGIYLDINGKWSVHPESERLRADGFGSCPDCKGNVKFSRWMRRVYKGMSGEMVACTSLSLVECDRRKECGYITKLKEHKERVGSTVCTRKVCSGIM